MADDLEARAAAILAAQGAAYTRLRGEFFERYGIAEASPKLARALLDLAEAETAMGDQSANPAIASVLEMVREAAHAQAFEDLALTRGVGEA